MWKDRLQIYGVDLRNLPSVERSGAFRLFPPPPVRALVRRRRPLIGPALDCARCWRSACHTSTASSTTRASRLCARARRRGVLTPPPRRTVRRPPLYFKHLIGREMGTVREPHGGPSSLTAAPPSEAQGRLPGPLRPLLQALQDADDRRDTGAASMQLAASAAAMLAPDLFPSALLSQLKLTHEDREADESLFPVDGAVGGCARGGDAAV